MNSLLISQNSQLVRNRLHNENEKENGVCRDMVMTAYVIFFP